MQVSTGTHSRFNLPGVDSTPPSELKSASMAYFVALATTASLVSTEGQPGAGLAKSRPSFGSNWEQSGVAKFLG